MFCAIATTIERCKTEGVVDVFQVVKALRVQKPGAVPTVVSTSEPHSALTNLLLPSLSCRDNMKQCLRQFLYFWTLLIHILILGNSIPGLIMITSYPLPETACICVRVRVRFVSVGG